ncbi:MAG: hypothetical protein H6713_39385 [Myxococcales bacterium]|nr:hypothetical protein [Myxococcales bacterium]
MVADPAWWRQQIAESLDAHGDIAPPWARCPEIPLGSIGWRMGYGEHWLTLWYTWLSEQPTARADRLAYLRRHPPAPRTWAEHVARVLEPSVDRDRDVDEDEDNENDDDALDADEPWLRELIADGLVQHDAARLAWARLHGAAPPAPWAQRWHDGSLLRCACHGARELTFFTRWGAARRKDRRLASWLAAVPPAPAGWSAFVEALTTGSCPRALARALAAPAQGWAALAITLAADGLARAPWRLGVPASSFRDEHGDDVGYADAWCWWAFECFDDRPTWRGYLDASGPVPADWLEIIARELAALR